MVEEAHAEYHQDRVGKMDEGGGTGLDVMVGEGEQQGGNTHPGRTGKEHGGGKGEGRLHPLFSGRLEYVDGQADEEQPEDNVKGGVSFHLQMFDDDWLQTKQEGTEQHGEECE